MICTVQYTYKILRCMNSFHSTIEAVNVIDIAITVPYRNYSHLQMLTLSLVVPDLTSPGRKKKDLIR